MTRWLETLGKRANSFLIEITRISRLCKHFLYWAVVAPVTGNHGIKRHALTQQVIFMGNESVSIVLLVATSVGAVLALQAAYQLRQFGAVLYTGALVSVSVVRELAPIITAIVISGRVGASVTAELGTMKVQEEVDALSTMGIPPIPFLVVPRIAAICITLPCLTILSDVIGIWGGFIVGTLGLGIDPSLYLDKSFNALVPKDIITGLVKSLVFAMLIGVISTYKGLSVEGGAEGVGKATTQSVVLSIISIILSDCLLTGIFYYIFP